MLWWRSKSFSPVFGSNRLRFCSYKLPASEKNLSENNSSKKYFLTKLARCEYLVMFKSHQFNILASSVSAFKFSVAKMPIIYTLISSSTESCCSFSCIAAFDSVLGKE